MIKGNDYTALDENSWFLGKPIDIVYKRISSVDLDLKKEGMDKAEETLARAYESNKTCFVNSYKARLAGNKYLLPLIKSDEFLPTEELLPIEADVSACPETC